jgi:uncharacterized protein YndB with AHSA1/START domain
MTTSTEASVRTSVTVEAPVERAFDVFTKDMKSWWPPEHHILASELVDTVVEPQPGGAMYDVGADGSTCRWGTVLAYEPPTRFVFQWNITLQWQIELDPAKTSEVEVRFRGRRPIDDHRRARAPASRSPRRRLGEHARRRRLTRRLGTRPGPVRSLSQHGLTQLICRPGCCWQARRFVAWRPRRGDAAAGSLLQSYLASRRSSSVRATPEVTVAAQRLRRAHLVVGRHRAWNSRLRPSRNRRTNSSC